MNKRSSFLLFIIFICFFSSCTRLKGMPHQGRIHSFTSGQFEMAYLAPDVSELDDSWSLMILFYPIGYEAEDYLESWAEEAMQHHFILMAPRLSPDMPIWVQDIEGAVLNALNALNRNLKLSGKVFLLGSSWGATPGFELALRYPERFQAAVFWGGSLSNYLNSLHRYVGEKIEVPIMLMWGAEDPNLNHQVNDEAAGIFDRAGLNVIFRQVDGAGHEEERFSKHEILTWMEAYKLSNESN